MTKFAENHVGGAIINIFRHLKRNIDIVKKKIEIFKKNQPAYIKIKR